MSMGSSEASISSGERILSMDSSPSCTPTTIMISDTARPDRYSMRPCPKGWPGSGFFDAMRKPSSVITLEPASDRLLKASAVTAMEPASVPAMYLPAKSRIFRKIPVSEHSMPYALRTAGLVTSPRFLMKILDSSVITC